MKIGAYYWVLITLDPDAEDWENEWMPARYAGNDQWYFLGVEDVSLWPVSAVGDEIKHEAPTQEARDDMLDVAATGDSKSRFKSGDLYTIKLTERDAQYLNAGTACYFAVEHIVDVAGTGDSKSRFEACDIKYNQWIIFEGWDGSEPYVDHFPGDAVKSRALQAWLESAARAKAQSAARIAKLEAEKWQPIETAPKAGYIVVAVPWGSRYSLHMVHNEYDEWIDVSSDEIVSPLYWVPAPPKLGEKP